MSLLGAYLAAAGLCAAAAVPAAVLGYLAGAARVAMLRATIRRLTWEIQERATDADLEAVAAAVQDPRGRHHMTTGEEEQWR